MRVDEGRGAFKTDKLPGKTWCDGDHAHTLLRSKFPPHSTFTVNHLKSQQTRPGEESVRDATQRASRRAARERKYFGRHFARKEKNGTKQDYYTQASFLY